MRESEGSSIDKYITIQRRNKMANQAPPKFIKLFNQIALGEAQAGKYLKAWANTTNEFLQKYQKTHAHKYSRVVEKAKMCQKDCYLDKIYIYLNKI